MNQEATELRVFPDSMRHIRVLPWIYETKIAPGYDLPSINIETREIQISSTLEVMIEHYNGTDLFQPDILVSIFLFYI